MKGKIITVFWGVLFLLAGGLLLAGDYLDSEAQGPAFMFLCALCFIGVAIWSKKNWWTIIPGGIFASLGLVAVLEIFVPHEEYPSLPNTLSWGVYTWALFLGLAATFGVLWLLRKTQPTDWAKYPAAGLLALAVLSFVLGSRFQQVWQAAVMLVIGAMFLLMMFTRKKLTAGQQTRKVKA